MSWGAAKDWSAGFSSGTEGSAAHSDQIRTDLAYGLGLGLPLKQVIGGIMERLNYDPKYAPDVAADLRGGQNASTTHSELERMGTRIENGWRNDDAFRAQFGRALAHDVSQRHESSVFAGEQLQKDTGLQRQAGDVLSAQQEYRRVVAANQDQARSFDLGETKLVGMIMDNPEAREWLGKTVEEYGLTDEAWQTSRGLGNIYPTSDERFVAAQLRELHSDRTGTEVLRAAMFTTLGEKLGLNPPRDLGDAEEHAKVGLDPGGFGETRDKVEQGLDGPHKLGAGIEADANAGIARHEQAVGDGQDKVAFRSAENKANVEHHQDINEVEGQRQTEAGAEAAKKFGSDANLASAVHRIHDKIEDGIKGAPEWVADKVYGPPPSVTEQILDLPPAASDESSATPKEEGKDSSAQKPE